jgi:hypothetical protein
MNDKDGLTGRLVDIRLAGMIDRIDQKAPPHVGGVRLRAVRCLMTNHRNSLLSLIENPKTYDD